MVASPSTTFLATSTRRLSRILSIEMRRSPAVRSGSDAAPWPAAGPGRAGAAAAPPLPEGCARAGDPEVKTQPTQATDTRSHEPGVRAIGPLLQGLCRIADRPDV